MYSSSIIFAVLLYLRFILNCANFITQRNECHFNKENTVKIAVIIIDVHFKSVEFKNYKKFYKYRLWIKQFIKEKISYFKIGSF